MTYRKTTSELATQETGGPRQRCGNGLRIVVRDQRAEIHLRMTQITAYRDMGDADKLKSRVLELGSDELIQHPANLLADSQTAWKFLWHACFLVPYVFFAWYWNSSVQCPCNFHALVALDLIANFDVGVVLDRNTALRAGFDLIDVVFEST